VIRDVQRDIWAEGRAGTGTGTGRAMRCTLHILAHCTSGGPMAANPTSRTPEDHNNNLTSPSWRFNPTSPRRGGWWDLVAKPGYQNPDRMPLQIHAWMPSSLHCRAARSSLPAKRSKIDRPHYQILHLARVLEFRGEHLAQRTRPDVDRGRSHSSGGRDRRDCEEDSLQATASVMEGLGSQKLSTTVSGSHGCRREVGANSERRSFE